MYLGKQQRMAQVFGGLPWKVRMKLHLADPHLLAIWGMNRNMEDSLFHSILSLTSFLSVTLTLNNNNDVLLI